MADVNKTILVDEDKLKKSELDAKAEYWDNVRKDLSVDSFPKKVKTKGYAKKNRRELDRRTPRTNMDIYGTNNVAVQYIEQQYPKTAEEFKSIQKDQYELFCKKQMDYGPSNIAMGTELKTDEEKRLSKIGLIVRINDKVQRLINLVVKNNRKSQNEPTIDAFKDLSCYGIIAQIVENGKWGK